MRKVIQIVVFTLIVNSSLAQSVGQVPTFQWVNQIGMIGSGNATGNSIYIDALGNIYTTGVFSGITDFDPMRR